MNSGPNAIGPEPPLSPQMINYYVEIHDNHKDDPATGKCSVCNVSDCPDRRFSWERLVASGQAARRMLNGR